ncbi:MAG: hypothetical protein ABID54_00970 [Pseudomonadota bacterium]
MANVQSSLGLSAKQPIRRRGPLRSPPFIGILGGAGLIFIYAVVIGLLESLPGLFYQMQRLWYWIFPLAFGFGIQVGLFVYVRGLYKEKHLSSATASITASGGVSALAMAACCAHHLTEILPVIGLAGLAIFLADYQKLFLLLGILSNLAGIVWMLRTIQRAQLTRYTGGMLRKLLNYDMRKAFYATLTLSTIVMVLAWVASNLGYGLL